MAKNAYISINNVARKIKKGYIGVDGVARKIKKAYIGINGIAYEIGVGGWSDTETGLEFTSANAFTISVSIPSWNGTLEYHNGEGWKVWDGSEISSGENDNKQCIYIRGIGNSKITGSYNTTLGDLAWTLTGTNIECNGNIENLLDYSIVASGKHPTMANYCYGYMFYNCTSLISAPDLPATTISYGCYSYMFAYCTALISVPRSLPAATLQPNCYRSMFFYCTSLTTAPSLPAIFVSDYCCHAMFEYCTSLITIPKLYSIKMINNCYSYMFNHCTKIKLSSTQTGTYTIPYQIPWSGPASGSYAPGALTYMFNGTGGTFTETPTVDTTYYLDSSITLV